MKKIFLLLALGLFAIPSFSQEKGQEKRRDQKPPTIEELFTQLDANKDGFLTKEELEKAPKPERPEPPKRE